MTMKKLSVWVKKFARADVDGDDASTANRHGQSQYQEESQKILNQVTD
jgi:hypothetical protein